MISSYRSDGAAIRMHAADAARLRAEATAIRAGAWAAFESAVYADEPEIAVRSNELEDSAA